MPLRTNKGADSGFRRTACLHPRLRVSAGLRFAVILLSKAIDREAAKSGAYVGTSSTAAAVPLPLNRGRLKRARYGEICSHVGRSF